MKKKVSFENIEIAYTDFGQGPVMVLLHGYLLSSEIWGNFAKALSDFCRVVAIDIPGHGASGVLGKVHNMDEMANGIKKILDEENIEKCMLLGHSMGGYIVQAFVAQFPERVNAFCLFHSTPFADNDEKRANRDREIALVKENKRDALYNVNIPNMFADDNVEKLHGSVELAKAIARNIPSDGIVALLNGMKERPNRLELLQNSQIPFLLVLGKKDNYIPYEVISDKIGIPKSITKLILEGSGHMGFVEEEEKSIIGIKRFLVELGLISSN